MSDYGHAAFLLIKDDWLAKINAELDAQEQADES